VREKNTSLVDVVGKGIICYNKNVTMKNVDGENREMMRSHGRCPFYF